MTRNWTEWLKAAAWRAVRTFAQTAVSMLTVGQAFAEINWLSVLSISGVAAVYSILMSLAGLPEAPAEPLPQVATNEASEDELEVEDDAD